MTKGQDPKSFVSILYHGDAKWSPEAKDDLEQLSEVMDIRLREVLREELGGVYGVFSRGSIDRRPKQRYTYRIGFGCAPENVEKLRQALLAVIDDIKKNGVADEYIGKLKEIRKRQLETSLRENWFWMQRIVDHVRHGTDPATIVEVERKAVERVSSEAIQRAARKFLAGNRIDGLLVPEKAAPDP